MPQEEERKPVFLLTANADLGLELGFAGIERVQNGRAEKRAYSSRCSLRDGFQINAHLNQLKRQREREMRFVFFNFLYLEKKGGRYGITMKVLVPSWEFKRAVSELLFSERRHHYSPTRHYRPPGLVRSNERSNN